MREIHLLQRKVQKLGKNLGKTTGWIHRASLKAKGVNFVSGVEYKEITDVGLLIAKDGKEQLLEVDTIVLCAGQLPQNELADAIDGAYLIGGADVAAELDAKRAINQGTRLAAEI